MATPDWQAATEVPSTLGSTDPFVRENTTFHVDDLGMANMRHVADIAARDAIPESKRYESMQVLVDDAGDGYPAIYGYDPSAPISAGAPFVRLDRAAVPVGEFDGTAFLARRVGSFRGALYVTNQDLSTGDTPATAASKFDPYADRNATVQANQRGVREGVLVRNTAGTKWSERVFGFAVHGNLIFFGGSDDTNGTNSDPRCDIFLGFLGSDGNVQHVIPDPVITRADAGGADSVEPFSTIEVGGTIYLFCKRKLANGNSHVCVFSASNASPADWGTFTDVLDPSNTGNNSNHAPFAWRDETDPANVYVGWSVAPSGTDFRMGVARVPAASILSRATYTILRNYANAALTEDVANGRKFNYGFMRRLAGRWELWYSSGVGFGNDDRAIYRLTSTDALSWVAPDANDWVLKASNISGRLDENYATMPRVHGSRLYYAGRPGSIGTDYKAVLVQDLGEILLEIIDRVAAAGGGGPSNALVDGQNQLSNDLVFYREDGGNTEVIAEQYTAGGGIAKYEQRVARGDRTTPTRPLVGDVVGTWTTAPHNGSAFQGSIIIKDRVTTSVQGQRLGCDREVEITNSAGTKRVTLVMRAGGDLEIMEVGQGLIQKSPDGTRRRLVIDNAGAVSSELA